MAKLADARVRKSRSIGYSLLGYWAIEILRRACQANRNEKNSLGMRASGLLLALESDDLDLCAVFDLGDHRAEVTLVEA